MWPTSIAVWKRSSPPQLTAVALAGLAQIRESRLVVTARLDAAQMPAVLVRTGDELALAQRLVGDDPALEAERAERASARAEGGSNLLVGRRPSRAERVVELRLAQAVVAAHEGEHERPSSLTTGIAFDVAASSTPRKLRERLDRRHARRLDLLRSLQRLGKRRRSRNGARDLEVGGIVAVFARDERVLAGLRPARGSRR